MCGISGQVRDDSRGVEPALLERMCAALEHRGPDARGSFVHGPVGLAIQRLRVIDLRTGDQPIFNEDRSIAVVLNGEIYNYRELRDRLRRSGHRFSTEGDTEAIVHLYEERGPDCVGELHGMFAFALWDARRRTLLLARDRLGKKPLLYALRPGAITFASELNAVRMDPEVADDVDSLAIDRYLAYQYVPDPLTAFRAVRKLPPASTLVYRDGGARIERYWRLDYGHKRPPGSRAELCQEVRAGIDRAVRRRLVADVPLGAFLSGGIDSSAVVASMAAASSQPVRTFSIGFASEAFDELGHARRIAELFGTEHHELVVEPDAIATIPRLVRQYGEPFGDPSALPSFHLAAMARREVTVALNGDGGDEAFGGYPRYVSNLALERLARAPKPARRVAAAAGRRLPGSDRVDSTLNRLRRAARALAFDPPARYGFYVSGGLERDWLYSEDYRRSLPGDGVGEVVAGPWQESSARSLTDRMLDVDVATYLPGDLLVKMDIATMAHGLEARSPLLDHELLELTAAIPAALKVHGLQKKVILREALRGSIPDDLLDRPKRGFELPIAEWFRGELRGYLCDVLFDPAARGRGYFREDAVRTLVDSHLAGEQDNAQKLWTLMMLELWHQELVDRPPGVPVPAG